MPETSHDVIVLSLHTYDFVEVAEGSSCNFGYLLLPEHGKTSLFCVACMTRRLRAQHAYKDIEKAKSQVEAIVGAVIEVSCLENEYGIWDRAYA